MLALRPLLGRFARMPACTHNLMDRLPEEVILHILSYLDISDVVHLQLVSARYLLLARDNTYWKTESFLRSRAEALRRRQALITLQDARLVELRNAVAALPGNDVTVCDVAQLVGSPQAVASEDLAAEARFQRMRAFANWDPGYPGEKLDYYEEYIHRHASIQIGLLDLPKTRSTDKDEFRETCGVGVLTDHQNSAHAHVVASMDDGSICLWDLSPQVTARDMERGRIVAKSKPGLLTNCPVNATAESHAIMTETGAVECVSINNEQQRGYFAVRNILQEVDLRTLQLIGTKNYPFSITALSEASASPLTVGTNMTIHLHDPRDPAYVSAETDSSGGELIGGSLYSHATLAQPGPLSILHQNGFGAEDGSIWVGGRFTSLLNYDRRFFPRLRGTVHSGARIASLSTSPYPFISRDLDLLRNPDATISALQRAKDSPGTTILAAAEYKGKGSLEMYGQPCAQYHQNRQTASASKLLSVAPHGGKIVFSDGDGHIKWVERDGFTHIRTFNINDVLSPNFDGGADDARVHGIWSSSGSEMPGQGDIVQKIIPIRPSGCCVPANDGRLDVNQDNLLLWTGDGRLGVLGFGHGNPLGNEQWHDAVQEQALSTEQRAREDAERQYGMAMRRALERNADEVRFVRGLGMGFMRN